MDNATQLCGRAVEPDSPTWTLLANFRYYGQGVSVVVFGTFGLVGNTLAIVTIASMPKVSLFYKLLIALAVFDVVFILTGGLFIAQTAFGFYLPLYNRLFPLLIYPAAGISMTGSTYACLSIAAERFFGICYPNRHSWFRKFRFYAVGIVTACVLIDAPRFFEVQTVFNNVTGEAEGIAYTPLRTDGTYILAYFMWYRLLATIALPFGLMLFFNIKVFSYYKRNSLQSHSHQEKSLLAIFMCITATFFLCQMPRVVLNLYEFHLHRHDALCRDLHSVDFTPPPWVLVTRHIEKILLILNASANFVYYCFSGREFRNRFCHIVGCLRHKQPRGRQESLLLRFNSQSQQHHTYETATQETTLTLYSGGGGQHMRRFGRGDTIEEDEEVTFGEEEEEDLRAEPQQVKVMCVHFLGHIYGDNNLARL